jgi:hypothetical protein
MNTFQAALQGPLHIETITAILLTILLLVCIGCLFLLFWYAGRVRSYGLHQQIIFDTLKERKKAEEMPRLNLLQMKQAKIRDEVKELERALQSAEEEKDKQELSDRIATKNLEMESTEVEIRTTLAEIENEAANYAKSIVPNHISLSEQFGPYFYIEFGTVIVIIFALLYLALLNAIEGQDVATILAAIAGYVLGKVTGSPTAKRER